MNTSTQTLDRCIRAGYSIIAIASHEESRVMSSILNLAKNMRLANSKPSPRIVCEWSYTKGLNILSTHVEVEQNGEGKKNVVKVDKVAGMTNPSEFIAPDAALEFISKFDEEEKHAPVLFVIKDVHKILDLDIRVLRFLRDIAIRFETRKHNLILLSPNLTIPADVEKQIAVIDWELPDTNELDSVLRQAENELDAELVTINGKREELIQAMRGLTLTEASNALTAGIVASGKLDEAVLPFILSEKKQIIRKSGILEYFEATVTMNEVGGLDGLKSYAARTRNAMTQKAREAGVDAPKGVLLVGPPGSGKSLSAKAIAGGLYPLLRLDMGKLLGGGRVGEAENNISSALKVAEAIAPCVLWVDEVEKALADNGGASDGGVMMRVLGSFLTWMQETTAPVYTVATANSANLRPELISRFDDVIFVDLPKAQSRLEILNVHLIKRGVKAGRKGLDDFQAIVSATTGFSGREIEKVVKFAVKNAFFDGEPVSTKYLLDAAEKIVPTSETKKDEILALREWAQGKALLAETPEEKTVSVGRKQIEI